jgi:hypothetical protein
MNNTIPSRIETLSRGYDGVNASAIIESLRSIQLYLNFLVSLDFYLDDSLSFPIVINQSMHALHELLHEAALNEKEAEDANQYFPKVLRGVTNLWFLSPQINVFTFLEEYKSRLLSFLITPRS